MGFGCGCQGASWEGGWPSPAHSLGGQGKGWPQGTPRVAATGYSQVVAVAEGQVQIQKVMASRASERVTHLGGSRWRAPETVHLMVPGFLNRFTQQSTGFPGEHLWVIFRMSSGPLLQFSGDPLDGWDHGYPLIRQFGTSLSCRRQKPGLRAGLRAIVWRGFCLMIH